MSITASLIIIFSITLLGVFFGKKGLFNNSQIEGFEIFLFKIAAPCYLFTTILKHDFYDLINVPYITCSILCFLIIAVITASYFWVSSTASKLCIKMLSAGYVNTAIYGLPIISFLLGDPRAAILSNLIQIILIQSIFITLLSFINDREKSIKDKLFSSILTPFIILPVIGLTLIYFKIQPHYIITNITSNLGNGASSLSLFLFGLSLSSIKLNRNNITSGLVFLVLAKSMLHPIISFLIGFYIFDLDKYWLTSLVIIASAPTGFMIYRIAKQFSSNIALSRTVITITSMASLFNLIIISFLANIE